MVPISNRLITSRWLTICIVSQLVALMFTLSRPTPPCLLRMIRHRFISPVSDRASVGAETPGAFGRHLDVRKGESYDVFSVVTRLIAAFENGIIVYFMHAKLYYPTLFSIGLVTKIRL